MRDVKENLEINKKSIAQLIRICEYLQTSDYVTISARVNSLIDFITTNEFCTKLFANILNIEIDLDTFLCYDSNNYFILPANIEEQVIVLLKFFERYYKNTTLNFLDFVQAVYQNQTIEEAVNNFTEHLLKPFSIEIISYLKFINIEENSKKQIHLEDFFLTDFSKLVNSLFFKLDIPPDRLLNYKKILFSFLDEGVVMADQEEVLKYYTKFAYCHNSNNLDLEFIDEFLLAVAENVGIKGLAALYKICANKNILEKIFDSYAYV